MKKKIVCDHSNESYCLQYFHVALFTVLHKDSFNCIVCRWNLLLLSSTFMWFCLFIYYLCCTRLISLLTMHRKPWCVNIQMKAIEQYFLLVLFIFHLCPEILVNEIQCSLWTSITKCHFHITSYLIEFCVNWWLFSKEDTLWWLS